MKGGNANTMAGGDVRTAVPAEQDSSSSDDDSQLAVGAAICSILVVAGLVVCALYLRKSRGRGDDRMFPLHGVDSSMSYRSTGSYGSSLSRDSLAY